MTFKRPDGVIGPDTLATTSVAVGVWTPQDQQQNQGAGTWPIVSASTPTSVQNINVLNGGSGYDSTSPPTVTVAPPPSGTTATAVATVVNGVVIGIDVTSGGSGYGTAPIVTIAPPVSGTTADAAAQLKNPSPPAIVATGGTITTVGGYKIHTFTSSGTFNVTSAPTGSTVDILLVGGGGGGTQGTSSQTSAAGGGGGGVLYNTSVSISVTAYSIVVGAGGVGGTALANTRAENGANSTGLGYTATGGGSGGRIITTSPYGAAAGGNGGSGGGGSAVGTGVGTTAGTGITGQGSAGGAGGSSGIGGGGGGGGGGTGVAGSSWLCWGSFYRPWSGNGGPGRQSSISGTLTTYGAGGGAGVQNTSPANGIYALSGNGGFGSGSVKFWYGTASGSGTTLTVSAVSSGQIYVGSVIWPQSFSAATVTAFGSGTGGIGTYTTNLSQTFSSRSNINGVYYQTPSIGTGGAGDGGSNSAGGNAAANTGSGGGGGAYNGSSSQAGGNGGSGIVIIRYPV